MSRTHAIRLLASAALLTATTAPANSAIFDQDDRHFVSPYPRSPYSPVGLVSYSDLFFNYRATGFLVDDCHVLTVQSLLRFSHTQLGKQLRFTGALGTEQQVAAKGTVVAVGGPRRNRSSEWESDGRDWLLLRLDKCIGASLGHVDLKTGPFSPYEFRNVQSIGYPSSRNRRKGLSLDPSCRITGGLQTVWMNDCATAKGDGGDPIFRVSHSRGKPSLEVYAMQAAGVLSTKPIPLRPGYDNRAVPMSLIAPLIEGYLSRQPERVSLSEGETSLNP